MKKLAYVGLLGLTFIFASCNTEKNDDGTTDSMTVDTSMATSSSSSGSSSSGSSASSASPTTDSTKKDTLPMSADPTRSQKQQAN